jgi:hypothetical protein
VTNVRDDKILTSSFWRPSFEQRRYLVPASSYCEPKGEKIAASGRHVVLQCGRCPNRRLSRTTDLDLPMDTPVSLVGALLECCECGSTEVLVYPESVRDARRGRVR